MKPFDEGENDEYVSFVNKFVSMLIEDELIESGMVADAVEKRRAAIGHDQYDYLALQPSVLYSLDDYLG